MSRRPQLEDALAALMGATEPASDTKVLVADSVGEDRHRWRGLAGRTMADAELPRALARAGQLAVVAASRLDAALLGALSDHPPALFVLTGPAEPELVADLADAAPTMALLGPSAALRRGEGGALVACAHRVDELDRLCDALPDPALSPALALAPTPAWLPRWLRGGLAELDVLGYVAAAQLDLPWIDWLDALGARAAHQLLVPLGLGPVELERAQAPGLEATVVAHALERMTGPLYPAPQVLTLLREALRRRTRLATRPVSQSASQSASQSGAATPESTSESRQHEGRPLWDQARRALPGLGELEGMGEPDPALSLRVPTAAFLAQRGLLRVRAGQRLLAQGLPEADPPPDPSHRDRADAVLTDAGEVLSDQESKVVLRGHGIEVTRQAFANSASGAAAFADKIGYPVALKALSPDLRRKRELGAVELDVPHAAAVKRAYATIIANVEERAPLVQLDGVVVAEMIGPGLDLRCGGLRMRSGGVAIFGQPIVDVPVEPVLARSPLDEGGALLLAEAVLAATPRPRRRSTDPDVDVLARLLLRIDVLFRHTGERLLVVDLAPVRLVDSQREYVTLDARIVQRPHLEGR